MGLTRITSDGITDAAIVNADINASAAIAGTKINPAFTSALSVTKAGGVLQTIEATDSNQSYLKFINSTTGNGTFTDGLLVGLDTDETAAFWLYENKNMRFATNGTERLTINADGHIDVVGNLDVGAGLDVTGNITATGTLSCGDITSSDGNGNLTLKDNNHTGSNCEHLINFTASDDTSLMNIGTPFGSNALFFKYGSTELVKIDANAQVDFAGNVDCNAGLDVTGNITVSGTVDGVDIAALSTTVSNITTDVVSDTSPQLGGDLDSNNFDIHITDNKALQFGDATNPDLYIKHSVGHNANFIVSYNGDIEHHMTSSKKIIKGFQNSGTPYVSLYQNGNEKFRTRADGVSVFNELSVGTSDLQSASVASFVGGQYNQVNIADGSNTGWGLLLAQQQGTNSSSLYTYSTNSSTNKPCSVVNVNNDALHFGTNNTARFRIEHDGHVLPSANNSYDLGSTSNRWRNIYTNDLNLSNEGGSNDVDGTWGSYTIQEGAEDLFLVNKRNGKKYKFNLTEVS